MNEHYLYFSGAYLLGISLLAAILAITDKRRAVKGRRRISEHALITAGLLGGALCEYITMRLIRHKTMHKKFMLGLPAIVVLHIAAVIALCMI